MRDRRMRVGDTRMKARRFMGIDGFERFFQLVQGELGKCGGIEGGTAVPFAIMARLGTLEGLRRDLIAFMGWKDGKQAHEASLRLLADVIGIPGRPLRGAMQAH